MMKEILNPKVTPKPTEPPPATPPVPAPNPTWAVLMSLLKFAGLPDKASTTKLNKLADQYDAELAKLKGYSHTDARLAFKKMVRECLDVDSAKKLPTSDEVIRSHASVRRIIKANAAKHSREARLIAADLLEQAMRENWPKFRDTLLNQEQSLLAGVQLPDASPLRALLEKTPLFAQFHISNLRADNGSLTNPRQIFNA